MCALQFDVLVNLVGVATLSRVSIHAKYNSAPHIPPWAPLHLMSYMQL